MDYGDDPVLSTQYAQVHLAASQALQPSKAGMLDSLRNRRRWLGMSLQELRTQMVTPAMLLAAGATWQQLHTIYGVDALIDFGFRWPDIVAAKVKGSHLRHFTKEQLQRLGVNAACALQCRPTAADIASLGYRAEELADLGWTLSMLTATGLTSKSMVSFGFPLQHWVTHFGVQNFAALGFTSYAECASHGWRDGEIRMALAPKVASTRRKMDVNAIRFI